MQRSGMSEAQIQQEIWSRRQRGDSQAAIGAAVGPYPHRYAVLELGVQVPLEKIRRFHDVHIGVYETQIVFHRNLPGLRTYGTGDR